MKNLVLNIEIKEPVIPRRPKLYFSQFEGREIVGKDVIVTIKNLRKQISHDELFQGMDDYFHKQGVKEDTNFIHCDITVIQESLSLENK